MSKSTKPWGVKEAAYRLAKALNAAGHKAEVVEGERGERGWMWDATLVVDGIELAMRQWGSEKQIFCFQTGYSQSTHRIFVSMTGKIDLKDVLESVESKRAFCNAVAKQAEALTNYKILLDRYQNIATKKPEYVQAPAYF